LILSFLEAKLTLETMNGQFEDLLGLRSPTAYYLILAVEHSVLLMKT